MKESARARVILGINLNQQANLFDLLFAAFQGGMPCDDRSICSACAIWNNRVGDFGHTTPQGNNFHNFDEGVQQINFTQFMQSCLLLRNCEPRCGRDQGARAIIHH